MYKKENNSWLKHIDFVILDILCLQLAFILAYEIRVAKGIPYLNPLYENMAFVLVIFSASGFIFLGRASAVCCEEAF